MRGLWLALHGAVLCLASGCASADRMLTHPFDPKRVTTVDPMLTVHAQRPFVDSTRKSRPAPPYLTPFGTALMPPPRLYGEKSILGRPLPYWVIGQGEETVLVFGGIHGDELTSSELAFDFLIFALENQDKLQGRRLVIAPLVNPDGFLSGSRNNARNVDLNRNFPANNWMVVGSRSRSTSGLHPRSEPETRFLLFLIDRFAPRRAVALHGAAKCVNWDGPAEDLARTMSTLTGLPTRSSIGYATPGSFGSLMGVDRQVPVITLELPSNQKLESADRYRMALLYAVSNGDDELAQ